MAEVAGRRVTAVEVTEAFLGRVEERNSLVNAICTLNPEALQQARACDARLASGAPARALEGVPFVAKDNLHTRGLRTTFGSRILEHFVPDEDAICVERMKAAGAILLGKTNTPEFAHDINTTNYLFGTTRNPRDLNRSAGGSSGGTGAAVACGMAPIGLGTDLGGSIRIPAAFCGIAGLRPVPGRVPVYPTDYGWDTLVEHVHGPLAATVADLGRMLSVLSGPDDRDPSSIPRQGYDYIEAARGKSSLKGRRVAFSPNMNGLIPVDPQVARLVFAAVRRLEDLGCVVEEGCFDASDIREIRAGTRAFGMVARYADLVGPYGKVMTPALARQADEGLRTDVKTVVKAEKMRTAYWHRVRKFMENYDYIVTPMIGAPAFRLDQPFPSTFGDMKVEKFRDVFLFSYTFSVTGLPAASVPCGFTAEGLPVGMQIVGHRMREDSVLEAAGAFANACPEHTVWPCINMKSAEWMTPEPLTDFP
ncbi:MAG: amidase [Burkholderiales bacterium]